MAELLRRGLVGQGHTVDVAILKLCDAEAVSPERLEEAHLCTRPDPGLKEVPHFPHYRRRYQERSVGPA